MNTRSTIRTLALGLLLVSGAADAGLFGKKKAKPAPPPPPEPAPVVVVPPPPPPPPIPLEFSGIQTEAPTPTSLDRLHFAPPEVLDTVHWVAGSKDNAGLPFIVIDKADARVYSFNSHAQLTATAPILLGMGIGDQVLVPPDAPMSAIPPQKRITPAGRYVSRVGLERPGKEILIIDAHNLISLHIVAKGTPAQRRAERLASVATDDNRVSYGCINVPPAFFTNVVSPDFKPAKGIVYILPEKTTAAQLFGFQPRMTAPVAQPPTVAVTPEQAALVAAEEKATLMATQTQSLTQAAVARVVAVAAEEPGPAVVPQAAAPAVVPQTPAPAVVPQASPLPVEDSAVIPVPVAN